MTRQTERPHVGKIALAAALGDRNDMVGVPQVSAGAPLLFKFPARGEIELPFPLAESFGIQPALGADSAVAGEHLPTQIGGIRAQPPLVHTGLAAEGEPAARNLCAAPTAQTAPPLDPAAGLRATQAHTRSS